MRPRTDFTLIRFLVRHALLGMAIGWSLLALMLHLDSFGLGTLVFGEHAPVALAMLAAGFAITFGSAAMATAIFLLRRDEDD